MVELYNIILSVNGRLTAGDNNVPGNTCRVKLIVPALAGSGIIGKKGEKIKLMLQHCHVRVVVDKNSIPMPGESRYEQAVRIDGAAKDMSLAFHMIMESVLTIGIGKGLE